MKAVTVHQFGGPEVLQVEEVQMPVPRRGEVLVEVHASSLNPVDAKAISKDSKYKQAIHLPATPGLDLAGVIIGIGEGVNDFNIGDRVFGQASVLHNGSGAFAEYAVTSQDAIALMPDSVTFIEAAALPLAACSAYEAVVEHMKLKPGDKVLIHGGSGGIGSFAIQIARNIGAHVTATASGDGITFAKSLGADDVIDYRTDAFEQWGSDYDAVLDTVGGDIYRKSFQVLRKGGILVSMVANPDEEKMRQFEVSAVLEMTRIDRTTLELIAALADKGFMKVNVDKTFPLEQTRDAYEAKQGSKVLGKIAIAIKK